MRYPTPISRFFRRFLHDQKGSVLLLFGLMVLFVVGIGGAAIDLGRQQLLTLKIQHATDAAATSGASTTNNDQALTQAEQQDVSRRYFNMNFSTDNGELRPNVNVGVAGGILTVSTAPGDPATLTRTNFVSNLGIPQLQSQGSSSVQANAAASSDYDVVMVVDESGSENACAATPTFTCGYNPWSFNYQGNTRMAGMVSALRTMTNSILPAGSTNQNVRIGIIGFSGRITNKWGLSSSNAAVQAAINLLRPVNQNYDHWGLEAAANMMLGGTAGVLDERIGGGFTDPTISRNTTTPPPRTQRTSPSDANGLSPKKFVIFLSDGGIMVEPNPWEATPCGARPCYGAFQNACTQVKNTAGADNVHLIVIGFVQPDPNARTTMINCASNTVPGGPTYSAAVKPDPNKDFFFAPDTNTLNNILTNVTTQLKSIRIVQ